MNKKLIALAVAGALAAPMAATAAPTLYGKAHLSLDMMDGDAAAADFGVQSRASRIGVKGSEDIGGGLKAVYKYEWGVDMAGDNSNVASGANNISARNQIVGLAGGFGTVAMGRHDTPAKMATGKLDVFTDTLADYNTVIAQDLRGTSVLAYLSPDFNGVHVNAAFVADDEAGTGDDPAATSIGATYENGPLFVAAASETYADALGLADQIRLGVGYKMGTAQVGFVYQDLDATSTNMVLNAAYGMGANTLKVQYGTTDPDAGNSQTLIAVGAEHDFAKSTSAYVLYSSADENLGLNNSYAGADAGGDLSGLSLGIIHKF